MTEKFPRNAVIKAGFLLTKSNRLTKQLTEELKQLYANIELI